MIYIILAIWFATAISIAPSIAPYTNKLKIWEQIVISIVIILGAPFMLITQAIELILDAFLAEGWNDDDKFGY